MLQIDQIWVPESYPNHETKAVHIGGSRATAADRDDHAARPAFQSVSEPSATLIARLRGWQARLMACRLSVTGDRRIRLRTLPERQIRRLRHNSGADAGHAHYVALISAAEPARPSHDRKDLRQP